MLLRRLCATGLRNGILPSRVQTCMYSTMAYTNATISSTTRMPPNACLHLPQAALDRKHEARQTFISDVPIKHTLKSRKHQLRPPSVPGVSAILRQATGHQMNDGTLSRHRSRLEVPMTKARIPKSHVKVKLSRVVRERGRVGRPAHRNLGGQTDLPEVVKRLHLRIS